MTSKKSYVAQAAPKSARFENCAVIITAGGRVFFKASTNPQVFVVNRRDVYIAEQFSANANDRRAYAKLAGITVAEINAAMKVAREASAKRAVKDRLSSLRRSAERLGYRLAKKKATKP